MTGTTLSVPRIARVARALAFAALIVSALTGSGGGPAGATGRFVTGLLDVPLMDDLSQGPAAEIVFETPAGRFVEARARGRVEPRAVLRFYRETLPQLGWCVAADGVFYREGERLMVEAAAGGGGTMVLFTLAPASDDGCR